MTAFVVDASVGVKWFAREDHTAEALRLQSPGFELHVPGFFDVEVTGVLWKKYRRGDISRPEATAFVQALMRVPIERHPDPELAAEAFDIAVETGRTVYDCMYLALAVRLGTQAITADEKLRNGLRGTTWEQYVRWVQDVP